MGPGFRPFGYILESRIFASGARLERARLGRAGIEAELGFRMARPLEGERASAVEARAAVATVAPAFELNQLRVAGEEDPAVRLADGLSQWGIVTGEERVPDLPLASLEVELSRDGAVLARADRSYPIDDHFESIAALARTLARFGLGLEAGHRVITGAYCRHALDGPGRWRASFAGVGTVELALA
jgi:2-keto-4-pentenoate hydratase